MVGGTAPDPTNNPHWFSGSTAGDGTGVAGIAGCYSVPPETLPDPPIGVLTPERFHAMGPERDILIQGEEFNEDHIRISLLLWRNDLPTQYANLINYRDSVPAVFRSHMQLGGTVNLDAFITEGRTGLVTWGGTEYIGWEFQLRIRRLLQPSYVA